MRSLSGWRRGSTYCTGRETVGTLLAKEEGGHAVAAHISVLQEWPSGLFGGLTEGLAWLPAHPASPRPHPGQVLNDRPLSVTLCWGEVLGSEEQCVRREVRGRHTRGSHPRPPPPPAPPGSLRSSGPRTASHSAAENTQVVNEHFYPSRGDSYVISCYFYLANENTLKTKWPISKAIHS